MIDITTLFGLLIYATIVAYAIYNMSLLVYWKWLKIYDWIRSKYHKVPLWMARDWRVYSMPIQSNR